MRRKAIYILIVFCLLLQLTATAVPPPFPCKFTNPNGLPLTGYGFQASGSVKCVYGTAAPVPCAATSEDGRTLIRAVVRANGRVKCVYRFVERR